MRNLQIVLQRLYSEIVFHAAACFVPPLKMNFIFKMPDDMLDPTSCKCHPESVILNPFYPT